MSRVYRDDARSDEGISIDSRGVLIRDVGAVLTFGRMMVEDDNRVARGLVSLSSMWDRDGEVSLDMIWTCVTGFSSLLISSASSTLCSTGIRSASFFVDACCSRLFDARRLRDSLTIRSGVARTLLQGLSPLDHIRDRAGTVDSRPQIASSVRCQ